MRLRNFDRAGTCLSQDLVNKSLKVNQQRAEEVNQLVHRKWNASHAVTPTRLRVTDGNVFSSHKTPKASENSRGALLAEND